MSEAEGFFDAEAGDYKARFQQMSSVHQGSAAVIRERARGRVVSIGGMWPGATPHTAPPNLAVIDISRQMLDLWSDYDAELLQADARALPLTDGSVETIVYPMILHHICDGTARGARQGVRDAFAEAHRVLAPGGQLIIVDYAVPGVVYAIERTLAPVTRAALALKGIPLVVMHSVDFYADTLGALGFSGVERVETGDGRGPFEMIQPVISLPWLRIPRALYPVRSMMLVGRR